MQDYYLMQLGGCLYFNHKVSDSNFKIKMSKISYEMPSLKFLPLKLIKIKQFTVILKQILLKMKLTML